MIPYLFKANQTSFNAGFIGTFDNALSCDVKEDLNGTFELNMSVLNNDPNLENMAIGSIIVAKPNQTQGNQAFVIEQMVKKIDGTIDIYATHIAQHRAKLIPIAPFTATSLADTLNKIPTYSQETNLFTISTNKTVARGFSLDVPKTLRELMGGSEDSILDIYGGEWLYNNFDLNLMNRRGRTDSDLKVLYGTNMAEYVETDEFNWSSSFTGVLPYYKDDQTLVIGDIQYSSHVDEYPYRKTITYDFSDRFESVPTKSQLEAEASSFLTGKGVPHISIEVSFEDLSTLPVYGQLNENVNYIQLGDTVEVINSVYNTQFRSRVRTLDFDVLLERYNTIQIGDQTTSINDAISDTVSDSSSNGVSVSDVYPVGSVITTSENVNPSSSFGGTWSLIDKRFISTYSSNVSSYFTINSTNTTSVDQFNLQRHGRMIFVRMRVTNAVAYSDSTVTIGTFNLSALGISSTPTQFFTGYSDGGDAMLIAGITTTGAMNVTDVIGGSGGTVAAGNYTQFTFAIYTFGSSSMLDSACNQFVWRRTA